MSWLATLTRRITTTTTTTTSTYAANTTWGVAFKNCIFQTTTNPSSSSSSTCKRFVTTDSKRLSTEQVQQALQKLSSATNSVGSFSWKEVGVVVGDAPTALTKTFHFVDFNQAWSFMTRVALMAEKMDHHPEWFNVYNRVEITLTTHDCHGISKKDLDMARAMDEYALALLSPSKGGGPTLSPSPPK